MPPTASSPKIPAKRGKFFLIDVDRATSAAKRSLNEGLAYLVLASGTQADNRTTSWSSTSVKKYLGVGVEHSKKAIQRLLSSSDIALKADSTPAKPRYQFAKLGERLCWLPRSLVEPRKDDQVPLLQRIKQTGDAGLLVVLLELYALQNLARDAALPREFFVERWSKAKLAEMDQYDIIGFTEPSVTHWKFPPSLATYFGVSKSQPHGSLDRLKTLIDIGALENCSYVWDSSDPESEPYLPVTRSHGPEATEIWTLAQEAMQLSARALKLAGVNEGAIETALDNLQFMLPVLRHRTSLSLERVLRLTHRPKTQNVARFAAREFDLIKSAKLEFKSISAQLTKKEADHVSC